MNAILKCMAAVGLLAVCCYAEEAEVKEAATPRQPVIVEGRQTLPLRVLTRPFSSVRAEPSDDAALVLENVDAFQPFYVYTRPPISDFADDVGWYEVGTDERGTVVGWMKGNDVMEWKQAMCLAYTHPDERGPVLMFRRRDPLAKIVKSDASEREDAVRNLYETVESQSIPEDFPLVSVEPKRPVFMFIEDQFYLLPILRHEAIELDGREGRMLQLAAATTAKGGRGATTVKDKQFIEGAVAKTGESAKEVRNLKIDLVYVIDTTASMQPYIDGTRKSIQRIANEIEADEAIADSVRFGLWVFRDSMDIEGIEYTTKNLTPELVSASELAAVLEKVDEAKVGSQGFPEDVFSGVDDALTQTAWSDNSMKILVVIGDAPAHPKGHKWNASGKGAEELSQFANDSRISILATHIRDLKDPRVQAFHDLTEEQFSKLAENRGVSAAGGSSYLTFPANDEEGFATLSDSILGVARSTLEAARKDGNVKEIIEAKPVSDLEVVEVVDKTPESIGEEAKNVMGQLVRAALVDWIGKEQGVQPPRDIVAWVVDKDLSNPAVPSLEVRVLVSKNEIDSLRTVLQELWVTGLSGEISGGNFFDALQATSAAISVTPEQIRNARTLSETGLIPEFLMDLPYRSRIMSMAADDWNNWSQDQQADFMNDLDAKIRYYRTLHNDPGLWVRLNPGDDPDSHVHPLSLEMLP